MDLKDCKFSEILLCRARPGYGKDLQLELSKYEDKYQEKYKENLPEKPLFFWGFAGVDLISISSSFDPRHKQFMSEIEPLSIYNQIYNFNLGMEECKLDLENKPLIGLHFMKFNNDLLREEGMQIQERFLDFLKGYMKCKIFFEIGWADILILCTSDNFEDIMERSTKLRNLTDEDIGLGTKHPSPLFCHSFTLPGCTIDILDKLDRVKGKFDGYSSFSACKGTLEEYQGKIEQTMELECKSVFGTNDYICQYSGIETKDYLRKLIGFWSSDDARGFYSFTTTIICRGDLIKGKTKEKYDEKKAISPVVHIEKSKWRETLYVNELENLFATYNQQVSRDETRDSFEDMHRFVYAFNDDLRKFEEDPIKKAIFNETVLKVLNLFYYGNTQRSKGTYLHTFLSYPYILGYQGGLQKILKIIEFLADKTLSVLLKRPKCWNGFSTVGYTYSYTRSHYGIINIPGGIALYNPVEWINGLAHELGHEFVAQKKLSDEIIIPDPGRQLADPEVAEDYEKVRILLWEILSDIFTLKYGFMGNWDEYIKEYNEQVIKRFAISPVAESEYAWRIFVVYLVSKLEKDSPIFNLVIQQLKGEKDEYDGIKGELNERLNSNELKDCFEKFRVSISTDINSKENQKGVCRILEIVGRIKSNEEDYFPPPPLESQDKIEQWLKELEEGRIIYEKISFPLQLLYEIKRGKSYAGNWKLFYGLITSLYHHYLIDYDPSPGP